MACRFSLFVVIQAGFEPTTRSLEGCCSIQLSYWTLAFRRQRKTCSGLRLSGKVAQK